MELFQIKCTVLKSDLKSLGFVPFGANLTHFGPKSGDPAAIVRYLLDTTVAPDCGTNMGQGFGP